MSYDITVTTEDLELDMNWLRNSFGLCTFAENNIGDGQNSLWHVCNDHAYDDSNNVDRAKLLSRRRRLLRSPSRSATRVLSLRI